MVRHLPWTCSRPLISCFLPAVQQHSPGKGDRVKQQPGSSSMPAAVVLHHVQHTLLAPADLKSQQAVLPPLPFARNNRCAVAVCRSEPMLGIGLLVQMKLLAQAKLHGRSVLTPGLHSVTSVPSLVTLPLMLWPCPRAACWVTRAPAARLTACSRRAARPGTAPAACRHAATPPACSRHRRPGLTAMTTHAATLAAQQVGAAAGRMCFNA